MRWLLYILIAIVLFLIESVILAKGGVRSGSGFLIVAISTISGLVICAAAETRGRSGALWLVYGALLPIVALIHVLVIGKDDASLEQRQIEGGDLKKCPHCADMIKAEASKCRYCHSDLLAA